MSAQSIEALKVANAVRTERAEQRDEFADLSGKEAIERFIDPPASLASYKVGTFFLARWETADGHRAPIYRFGPHRLSQVLRRLHANGFRRVTESVRLRDLNERERRALALLAWGGPGAR